MDMSTFSIIADSAITSTVDKFWNAINIWMEKPHIISKSIFGTMCKYRGIILSENLNLQVLQLLQNVQWPSNVSKDEIETNLRSYNILNQEAQPYSEINIVVRKMLLKKSLDTTFEIIILDKLKNQAWFIPTKGSTDFPRILYAVCYGADKISLVSNVSCDFLGVNWLKTMLFPKLIKWANENITLQTTNSLSLVSIEEYHNLYFNLKKKYGPRFIEIWPEETDPLKFVYEDVAIATYILLIWKKQDEEQNSGTKQKTFIDLGCGNGLLVYILTMEGHRGKGLDIRKRKIWDLYQPSVALEVQCIVPSETLVFPEVDWIIGNHSDELTPWIPVITARSSYKCSFFLLPCCHYDFNGRKYQRQNTSLSSYKDYFVYINNICKMCGFDVKTDRLKIPSTKRTCLVAYNRTHKENYSSTIWKDVESFIISRNDLFVDNSAGNIANWSDNIKIRSAVEKVQNCTKLQQTVKDEIINIVVKELLSEKNYINTSCGKLWNKGTSVPLNALAQQISTDLLRQLKSECGGLQTLLKNHPNIFFVFRGSVQLKTPDLKNKIKCKQKPKQKKVNKWQESSCWFHSNHPDGCLFSDDLCSFKH